MSSVLRIDKWWTVENWTSWSDLGLKLGAILAALAAIGFLSVKPEVVVSQPLPVGAIDEESLAQAYAPDAVPNVVLDVVEKYNSTPVFPTTLSLGSDFQLAPTGEGTQIGRAYETVPFPGASEKVLKGIYGTVNLILLPPYAVELALRGGLAADDLEFALRAIEESRVDLLTVKVANRGQATAHDVQLIVPAGLPEIAAFDLPPASTKAFKFDPNQAKSPTQVPVLSVGYDPTERTPDTRIIIAIGWGMFFLIWLPAVLVHIVSGARA